MNDDYLTHIDAPECIREVGYPFVAKPDTKFGAANTFKIQNGLEFTT